MYIYIYISSILNDLINEVVDEPKTGNEFIVYSPRYLGGFREGICGTQY